MEDKLRRDLTFVEKIKQTATARSACNLLHFLIIEVHLLLMSDGSSQGGQPGAVHYVLGEQR